MYKSATFRIFQLQWSLDITKGLGHGKEEYPSQSNELLNWSEFKLW